MQGLQPSAVALLSIVFLNLHAFALQLAKENMPFTNVCMEGHYAPELFVLGVPKAGTTSFFEDFVRSSAFAEFTPLGHEPSWHSKEAWAFAPFENDLSGKSDWLKHFAECQQDTRMVAIDATPAYFGCEFSPKTIHKFYAGSGHVNHLKFMVFLRNPVTRSHSHYYQYVENGVFDGAYGDPCPADTYPKTYHAAVASFLESGSMCGDCLCNDVFEDSMYAKSFHNFFQYFDTNQFFVVPFEIAIKKEIVKFAWDMLGMPHGEGQETSLASADGGGETNHHDYPTLEKDLAIPIREKFVQSINNLAGPRVLAEMLSGSGAHLFGFNGDANNITKIAEWLEQNWGS